MEQNDADIIAEMIHAARPQAFELLVSRYQGPTYALAYAITGDWAVAEDMTQEVFLRAYVRIGELRNPAQFAAWLRRLTVNCCLDHLRQNRRMAVPEADWDTMVESSLLSPQEEAATRERAASVQRAILQLPSRYRVPLVLCDVQEMSYAAAATYLGSPVGTIKSLVSRGRDMLRPLLTDLLEESDMTSKKELPPDFAAVVVQTIEAARDGDMAKLEAILKRHPRAAAEGGNGTTALHQSSWKGHTAVVELLLRHGANAQVQDRSDTATPLHYAAEAGHLEIVRLLVENGADPNGLGDGHGLGVIGWATCFATTQTKVAEFLLAHGAHHNMWSAVAMGDTDAVRRIAAERRGSVDLPPDSEWEQDKRPLNIAVSKKHAGMVKLLLELGASADFVDRQGYTMLDLAAMTKQKDVVQLLEAHGATMTLAGAIAMGRDDRIAAELAREPGLLKPGGKYAALLTDAAACGTAELVERLIALGAEVNARVDSPTDSTVKGITPLHAAAFNNNLDAIRTLVRHGADLGIRDSVWKATPLGWATYKRQRAAEKLLRELGGI